MDLYGGALASRNISRLPVTIIVDHEKLSQKQREETFTATEWNLGEFSFHELLQSYCDMYDTNYHQDDNVTLMFNNGLCVKLREMIARCGLDQLSEKERVIGSMDVSGVKYGVYISLISRQDIEGMIRKDKGRLEEVPGQGIDAASLSTQWVPNIKEYPITGKEYLYRLRFENPPASSC